MVGRALMSYDFLGIFNESPMTYTDIKSDGGMDPRNASHTINTDKTVAVAEGYYWQPMDSCPRGVKVQLLGQGGVAVYAVWDGRSKFWTDWAPLPRRRES